MLDNLGVEPEVDPGDDDEHTAGDIDCDEVVRELTLEHKINRKAAVFS